MNLTTSRVIEITDHTASSFMLLGDTHFILRSFCLGEVKALGQRRDAIRDSLSKLDFIFPSC